MTLIIIIIMFVIGLLVVDAAHKNRELNIFINSPQI
jgi:hypothetical protein